MCELSEDFDDENNDIIIVEIGVKSANYRKNKQKNSVPMGVPERLSIMWISTMKKKSIFHMLKSIGE